jgi:hypothetical protein
MQLPLANYPAGLKLLSMGKKKKSNSSSLTVKDILDEQIAYKLA